MSDIAIFHHLNSEASCKSLSLIDLSYLSREKRPIQCKAASTDLPVAPAAKKKFLSYVSSFACHFRFHDQRQQTVASIAKDTEEYFA